MTIQPNDSGTAGRYSPLPAPFSSSAYGRYQPTKDDLHTIFRRHLNKWRYDTLTVSSIEKAMEHEDFRAIIDLGKSVVPSIVREIEITPDLLVAALPILTGADPVRAENRGDMAAMAADWVEWFRNDHR